MNDMNEILAKKKKKCAYDGEEEVACDRSSKDGKRYVSTTMLLTEEELKEM